MPPPQTKTPFSVEHQLASLGISFEYLVKIGTVYNVSGSTMCAMLLANEYKVPAHEFADFGSD